jgi:hypothetical protein
MVSVDRAYRFKPTPGLTLSIQFRAGGQKNSCRLVEKSHFDDLRFQGYRTFTSYPDGLQNADTSL